MSRAFIVEQPRLDVSGAERFGKLSVLFRAGRYRPSVWEPAFAQAIVGRLREERFDPESDYIVLTGQQLLLVGLVAAVVAAYGKFTALAFNAHGNVRDYEPITMGDVCHDAASTVGVH